MKFLIDESVEKPKDMRLLYKNNEKLTCLCYHNCENYIFKICKKKTVKNEKYFKECSVIPFR